MKENPFRNSPSEIPRSLEVAPRGSYREKVQKEYGDLRIWDYLHYDRDGNLWIKDYKAVDLARYARTPLEIVDTRIIEDRAREWRTKVEMNAMGAGYGGGTEVFYATKADPAAEVVVSAINAGLNIEFSSQIDAMSFNRLFDMRKDGEYIIPRDIKVVCNGLKIHPAAFNEPQRRAPKGMIFESNHQTSRFHDENYVSMIAALREKEVDITPVIDSISEVDIWAQSDEVPPQGVDIGLRFKLYGIARNDQEQLRLEARHGMDWKTIQIAAERISRVKHLKLTTFHAMVGAAEVIPVDDFIDTLMYSAEKFFQLKKKYPTLKKFNIGGGIPHLGERYNHDELLSRLFAGLKQKAQKYGLDEPVVEFENGTLVAAEGGFHLTKVLQEKENSVDAKGNRVRWANMDLPFMRAIPDIYFLGKEFIILAANNANNSPREVILGDLTCDSDGRYPTKDMRKKGVRMFVPNTKYEEQYLVIVASKAYGEQLTGVGGVGHSGQIEPGEIIVYRDSLGRTIFKENSRQTVYDAIKILGYDDSNGGFLKRLRRR